MSESNTDVDVVIVGAGFAGMYLLHRMREAGFSAVVLETADDVGGTWYWNRYPGARCDILTIDYSYSCDPELAGGVDLVGALRHPARDPPLRPVRRRQARPAPRHPLQHPRRARPTWDDDAKRWTVHTDTGDDVTGQVLRHGHRLPVDAEGARHRGRRPLRRRGVLHQPLAARGRRLHRQAGRRDRHRLVGHPVDPDHRRHRPTQLTVFQRTPNFSIPAHNGPITEERLAEYRKDPAAYREEARYSGVGVPRAPTRSTGALAVSDEERHGTRTRRCGRPANSRHLRQPFNDMVVNPEANDTLRRVHPRQDPLDRGRPRRRRAAVPDEPLRSAPSGRASTPNYYETYNLPHVRLVDLRKQPITTITETGIELPQRRRVDRVRRHRVRHRLRRDDRRDRRRRHHRPRRRVTPRGKWAHGPKTYLGLMTVGFPNLFMITGPGQPVGAVEHDGVDRAARRLITDTIEHLRRTVSTRSSRPSSRERRWVQHGNEFADLTLLPTANSWYMGANVPGKPQVFLPYLGGVGGYRADLRRGGRARLPRFHAHR